MTDAVPDSGRNIQIILFSLAILVYAMFSSPTPDHFGFSEGVVAVFLFSAIGLSIGQRVSFFALGFGVTAPLFVAMISGHAIPEIIRDIIPFLFLFLPLFWGWIGNLRPSLVIFLVAMTGYIFSVRTLSLYHPILLTPALWGQGPPADLLYLANSPEVLFSALISIGYGAVMMCENGGRFKAFLLIVLSFLPITAMAIMTQRAGIGAVGLYSVIVVLFLMGRHPKQGCIFLGLLGSLGLIFWPMIETIFDMLLQKTELVGFNARLEEWGAVLTLLFQNWVTLFWGIGWGGQFENPAVGGLEVNYTHSLLSALLLKTGVFGSTIILVGCFTPVKRALALSLKAPSLRETILLGAALPPLLISVFLYASYKSLGFGLILLVFALFSYRKLEKNTQAVP
jgi:hypothetical protein